ncbi:MAG: Xaa-Pro dipeptidase [Solirubrobacteraceae bacterium]|jgi:Xaa-Pro aminopeptidase|nr:Xaa-Pro dipeptidase [Solirubrobacteraceae bacterium]
MQLPFDLATYRDRMDRTRASMRDRGVDALIVTLPDSIHWLTGFDTIGYLWAQGLLVDLSDDEPILHTRTTEEPGFRETCWLQDGVFYDIAKVDPIEVLARTIHERGLADTRVGVEMQAFTIVPAQWDELKRRLPGATFVDAGDIVPELRLVKSAQEIFYQRQAAQMADHAMTRAIGALRPGMSETEVAGVAAHALGEVGSEYAAIPPMVVSGPRSALVHAMATRRSISQGDVVCIELGASMHRYHAIVMRTAVIGAPTARVAEVAAQLKEAHEAAIAAARPGAATREPEDACLEVLDRHDLARRRCHRLGYSIGVAYPPGWLEPMMLVAGDPHTLAPGMSFSIEPNLSLQDEGFGIKLGETVLCVEDGSESLSRLDHDLVVV